jgi:hypothetical protein
VNPYLILAGLLSLGAAFGGGWAGHAKYRAGVDAEQALAQSETNRESERLAARNTARIGDALTQDRLRSERSSAAVADRLRKLASESSQPAGCPSRNDDPRPAAGILHDDTRNALVSLSVEADAIADRLRACQALMAQNSERAPQ